MVDDEIQRILDENYNRAKDLLAAHSDALHKISEVLIEKETLDTEQIDELIREVEGESPPKKPERVYAKWQGKETVLTPEGLTADPVGVAEGHENVEEKTQTEENI